MEAVRREAVITKDGQIQLVDLPYKRGERVEIIVLPAARQVEPHPKLTAGQLRQSGLIGMWKGRSEISDSSVYARRLREQAQRPRETR